MNDVSGEIDVLDPLQMFYGNLSEFGKMIEFGNKVQFGKNVTIYCNVCSMDVVIAYGYPPECPVTFRRDGLIDHIPFTTNVICFQVAIWLKLR